MGTTQTALVLGATGGIGGEVARQLLQAGWNIKALKRDAVVPTEQKQSITWLQGDAMNAAEVAAAARDCTVIVHAVNPPGYRRWAELVLPMLDNTIAAAESAGATIVLPGTIYNYGHDAFPLLTEASAQNAETRKGRIRVEMERRLQAYALRGGRVLIVRAGDYFGPTARNNWFSQGLVNAGKPVTRIFNPGAGVGHQWSYLPDVARTMVALLQRRESLERFACFHMAGHWDSDGFQMVHAIRRVLVRHGATEPRIAAFPWWLVKLASPFNVTFKEMLEMRYLWQHPLRMDNAKLRQVLGAEPHTPLDVAVEATLAGLGCISAEAREAMSARAARR